MNAAMRQIRRALLSVSDKSGLVAFAAALAARGVALLSTGGTARALAAAGLPVTEVAAVTGFPELLDGRVKTLHPAIHAGLLAQRERAEHRAALAAHGIAPIDLLVCNLYPFAATLAAGAGREACLENIDIGGPALIRAAAKNHQDVAVVIDPADYQKILAELAAHDGALTVATRRALAAKAFAATAAYDAAIAAWMAREEGGAAALRREPASGGRLLSGRRGPARGRERAAIAGQGAVLQQLRRRRRRFRAGRRIHPPGGRHRQARQSLRRRPRRRAVRGVGEGAGLRSGERLWRRRRPEPAA